MRKPIAITFAIAFAIAPVLATAAETVKVVVPRRGSWDSSFTELGMRQGFFKEQGLDLKIVYTNGDDANEQAIASGQADIGVASGFLDTLAAYVRGEPVRIISPESTGAPDLFWTAKIAGAIASMSDLHGKSVSYSRAGSASYFILLDLLRDAGVNDATLMPIANPFAGTVEVIGFQIDASWSMPPAAIKDLLSGEIRTIGRGNDSPEVRGQTYRVNVANANFLAAHRDAVAGFLKAYKKSVDWAYSGDQALQAFAALSDQQMEVVKYTVRGFALKAANQVDIIQGEDRTLQQALAAKRIPHAMTHDDVKGVYDLVLEHDH